MSPPEEEKKPWTHFQNMRISIRAPPKEAYTILCNAIDRIEAEHLGAVDWETTTYMVDDEDVAHITDELFPENEAPTSG